MTKPKLKKLAVPSIVFVLMVVQIVLSLDYLSNEYVTVPGTVYGKNENTATRYKSRTVSSEFWVAVHPDDSVKYKDYSIKVTFATFAKLKNGSHTQFRMFKGDVERDYNTIFYNCVVVMTIIACIVLVCAGVYLTYIITD